MPADIRHLKKLGISSGTYKKLFTLAPKDYPKPIKRLVDLIRQDVLDGRTQNLDEWRAYHAIDLAHQTPFNQHTPTLVHHIMSQNLDQAKTLTALENYGLSAESMYLKVTGQNGQTSLVPNVPVFYEIYIPIVAAYLKTVLAQIFNERNTSPLLAYRPLKETTRNRILCEIWTDIVETISTWYGYPAVLNQSILHMLKYGTSLTFPLEEWHTEYQIFDHGEGPQRVTIKEGIRYTHPHPSRMGCDLKYPQTSINTDTGTEWCDYWHILSYGQIYDEPKYWNRGSIFSGTNWFQSPAAGTYFDEVYPCTQAFPHSGFGTGAPTREDRAAWYTTSNRNQAVFVTEYYRKLIPSKWGLGDYKYPVWHHFTVAGDDTIVWAEPCAYTPAFFMGYDYDQMAYRNPSLALELMPWQDMLGNILSQMLLTAKQNLVNVHLFDTNQLDEEDIKRFKNLGEAKYRSMEFLPFDSMRRRAGIQNPGQAVIPVSIATKSISEHLQLFPQVLNLLERVVGVSAQDAGSSATHQQSKAEVIQTGGASKNRRALTAFAVDQGMDAMKRQQVQGFSAYGDPAVTAQVSSEIPDLEQHLQELGLKQTGKGDDKVLISGHKSAIRLESFAASNQGPDLAHDKETGQVIFSLCQTISGQEQLFRKVGARNILRMMEFATDLSGGPPGFELPLLPDGKEGDQVAPNILEAIQHSQTALMNAVEEKVAKPAAEQVAKVQSEVEQIQQIVKQLEGIYKIASAEQDKLKIKQAETQQKMTLKEKQFLADEKRKQEKHDLEMHATTHKAQVETSVKLEKAKADVAIQHHTATMPEPHKVTESIQYAAAPIEIQEQIEQQAGLNPPAKRTYRKAEKSASKPAVAKE